MSRFRPQDGTFTDCTPGHFFPCSPNGIIKAARLAVYDAATDDFFHMPREVHWTTSAGVVHRMLLVPYIMPSGASDITLGTFATDSTTGARTYTASQEGKFLYNTGALVPTASAPQLASNIEGMLFTEYFTSGPTKESVNDKLTHYAETLEEGDFFYLIREFDGLQVYASEDITSGLSMISSGATAGAVADAAAIDTGGTVAAYNTSLAQNLPGAIGYSKSLGLFTAARTGAGLVTAKLRMPPWRQRTTA